MINIDALNDDEKLAALESIHKSIAQSKEIQKKKITTNVELIVKALKKIEADLQQRYDETGKLIANLKNGEDGRDGKDGKDGRDGKNGRDGAIGPRGFDGIAGRNGADGQDGVSVVDAQIDFDGSLTITLSNGNVINAGEIVNLDLAEKIKVITNGGGTSQFVLDALASLEAQISQITSGLEYQGTWNASTNVPTLASSVGTAGYYYIVATAGSTNLNGVTDWQIGDWAVFNGSVWQKIDQTNLVTSVAGRTGAIVLTTADIGGLGTIATQAASNVAITGGSIAGITDLAIADGGTGQSTAAAAITALTGTQTSGRYLRSDGTNAALAAIVAGDVPTLNQNTTGTSANVTGTVAIANGGTGQTTANAAFNALAPSQTGNSGKYLTTNGSDTSWATNPLGTVTSVGGTGTVNGLTLTGTVTTSGNLTLGGTLSSIANSALTNSSITIGGTAIALGASSNTLANDITINSLTAGRGAGSLSSNSAFGASALTANTTGYNNTGIGKGALSNNLGAYNNTAVGFESGFSHNTGNNNTSVGSQALFGNQTGSENVALGAGALYGNDSGQNNVAIGYEALKQSTIVGNNTSVGHQSLYSSGQAVSAGSLVVGVSYKIWLVGTTNWVSIGAASNTAGVVFTATGVGSGIGTAVINGGANNTALGYLSGYSVTGSSNTLIGYSAGLSITTGSNNTTLGFDSGKGITTGSKNVIIGSYAGIVAPISMTGSNFIVLSDGDANVRGVFDSSGNFGVGTTSPGSRLDVKGTLRLSGSTSGYVGFSPAAAAGSTTYTLPSADGTVGQALTTNGSGTLSWASTASGSVTSVAASVPSFLSIAGSPITSSGTLAITLSGTALPTTSGGTGLTSFTANGVVYASSTSALATGSALTFDGTNLTVGTGASTYKLNVYGASSPYLGVSDGTINTFFGAATGGSIAALGTTSNHPVSFYSNSAEQMRLDSSGNLGIGTSSPAVKLDVSGAASTNSESRFVAKLADTSAVAQGNGGGLVFRGVYTGTTLVDASGIQAYKENATDGNYAYGLAFVTRANGGDLTANLRLNGSGNLGLGVTPSAWWSSTKTIQFGAGGVLSGRTDTVARNYFASNAYLNSTPAWTYIATNFATRYEQYDGQHQWHTAASGTAGDAITFTQAMTLDASGNLGVGTTSPSTYSIAPNLVVATATSGGMTIRTGANHYAGIFFADGTTGDEQYRGFVQYNHNYAGSVDSLVFGTAGAIKATLDSSGNLGIGTSSPGSFEGSVKTVIGGGSGNPVLTLYGGNATYSGVYFADGTTGNEKYRGYIEYNHANDSMLFGTTGGTKATLDASGNLGLGVTPAAWTFSSLSIGGQAASFAGDVNTVYALANTYYNAGWKYVGTGYAGQYQIDRSVTALHKWYTAPSGTAGNAITFTQAMTLDASGNLIVGGTSAPSLPITAFKTMAANNDATAGVGLVRFGTTYGSNLYHTYTSNIGNDGEAFGLIVGDGTAALTDKTKTKYIVNQNGVHVWYGATTSTERARIDSSGNLGVGTTSPLARIHGKSTTGDILILDGSSTTTGAADTGARIAFVGHDGVQARDMGRIGYYKENGTSGNYASYLSFVVRPNGSGLAEAARIDSSGNLLVGTTSLMSNERVSIVTGATEGYRVKTTGGASAASGVIHNATTTGDNVFLDFGTEASYTSRGSITYNRAGGLVAYNVTSDYRAKDISGPVTNSGGLIDSTPVYMGKMKGATQERPMFIAHEIPAYAHTGEKDAVDKDGNPVYQQMDASALIPVMWAEIQSLRKRLADAGI